MTKLEEVVAAICDASQKDDCCVEDIARAVIEVLKKANGTMTQAGAEEINPYLDSEREFMDNCEIALDAWSAMLDAILNEEQPK